MQLTFLDAAAFIAFILLVLGVSLYASRKEESSADYFLAGRSLSWWLIGFSLIASNISTEHFVGMAGEGFGSAGMAIASYEWIAAITLVAVALFLLPLFLKVGIYTMPEFLEHRYGPVPRMVMAIFMLLAYVGVAIASVLYAGAIGIATIFGIDMGTAIWMIGLLAGSYTIYGGLKAVVWSDLLQGVTLLVGGTIVTIIGFAKTGGVAAFLQHNESKLHVVLPADHPDLPWIALLLGIWIPNFFYWGFNQFITQRTLGAKNLAQGQLGIMFAAALKLLIPFIIVFPGIMAFQLYRDQIQHGDEAYAVLIQNVLPTGLRGILFAALFGAVMSSLDSMLNSASTIFTMDLYKRHLRPDTDAHKLVRVGRFATGVFVVAGCLVAPLPGKFEGVFHYIQMVWGFISPSIVCVFLFGLICRRAPAEAATTVMILGIPLYGTHLWLWPEMAFLNHMAITFVILVLVMWLITLWRPLASPVRFKQQTDIDLRSSPLAKFLGLLVALATVALYLIFW